MNSLYYIIRAVEKTLQYLAYIMIAELFEEIKQKKLDLKIEYFRKNLGSVSIGNIIWLIQNIGKELFRLNADLYMSEMRNIISEKGNFFKRLKTKNFEFIEDGDIPQLRNNLFHFNISIDESSVSACCKENIEFLTMILKEIAFLTKYKLMYIEEIKFENRSKFSPPIFHHLYKRLHQDFIKIAEEPKHDTVYTTTNSVVITSDLERFTSSFINLSPLVINTASLVTDKKKKGKIAGDTYLLSAYEIDKETNKLTRITYSGVSSSTKMQINADSEYGFLLEELNDFLCTIGGCNEQNS